MPRFLRYIFFFNLSATGIFDCDYASILVGDRHPNQMAVRQFGNHTSNIRPYRLSYAAEIQAALPSVRLLPDAKSRASVNRVVIGSGQPDYAESVNELQPLSQSEIQEDRSRLSRTVQIDSVPVRPISGGVGAIHTPQSGESSDGESTGGVRIQRT